jgi:hypothetical protein
MAGCDKGTKPPPGPGTSTQPASSTPATQAAPRTRPPRIRVFPASAPSGPLESNDSYTLTRGQTLARIAQLRYGNAHYSHVIELYNRLKDDTKLPIGLLVKTPDLKTILADEKLYPLMADETDALLAARSTFMEIEIALWDARKAAATGPLAITPEVKQSLLSAAEKAEKASAGFAQKKPGVVAVPAKAVNQMKSIALTLKSLAAGKCDENGYDIDMVHQRLVFALSDAILWARNGYK